MEAMPLPDESVDLVISNGVVNLSARKMRVLFECARVLRQGGAVCLTDVTIDESRLPPQVLTHPAAWSGCAAGAMAERALLRSLRRVGLTGIQVRERHALGVEDCARFPLFTAELLTVMRTTIPARDQGEIGTCVTVTAGKAAQDDATADLIASDELGNQTAAGAVLGDMDEQLPSFDAGDRHCGDGVGGDLRSWWDAAPAGTRTVVAIRDPSTKTDVPSLARMLGHTVEEMTEVDGTLRVTIRVKGP
jgi:TusA-related sulfurtransferase